MLVFSNKRKLTDRCTIKIDLVTLTIIFHFVFELEKVGQVGQIGPKVGHFWRSRTFSQKVGQSRTSRTSGQPGS